jgi:hypothetical protein
LLSLRRPLDGLPVADCKGADVGASESLSHPVLLARHSKSENLLSRVVFPDPASSALASAHRARHPAVGADRSYRTAVPVFEWLTVTPSGRVFVRTFKYQRRSRRAYSEHRSHSLARRTPSGLSDDKPASWNARPAFTRSQRPALLMMLSSDVGPSTNN